MRKSNNTLPVQVTRQLKVVTRSEDEKGGQIDGRVEAGFVLLLQSGLEVPRMQGRGQMGRGGRARFTEFQRGRDASQTDDCSLYS